MGQCPVRAVIIIITAPGAQNSNLEWKPSGMSNKNTIPRSLANPVLLKGEKNTKLPDLFSQTQHFWVLLMVSKYSL